MVVQKGKFRLSFRAIVISLSLFIRQIYSLLILWIEKVSSNFSSQLILLCILLPLLYQFHTKETKTLFHKGIGIFPQRFYYHLIIEFLQND